MYKSISYFKGLHALRFFAAYFVLMEHAEQFRLKYGMFNLKELTIFRNGGIAVTFFFVLSGFLITYLLLKEKNKTKTVSIKKFYMRRVLRIWPLYYLLVFIGLLVIPLAVTLLEVNYTVPYQSLAALPWFVFFMPFVVNIIYGAHALEPLWSIGVEELFYLFWAPLMKIVKNNPIYIFIAVIVLKTLVVVSLPKGSLAEEIVSFLRFEAMAIGGIGALLLYNAKKSIESLALFSKGYQYILFLFIFSFVFFRHELADSHIIFHYLFKTPVFSTFLFQLLFVWLIINVAVNENSLLKPASKPLTYLGEISYGIYMYHVLIVSFLAMFGKELFNQLPDAISSVAFYVIASIIVFIVSGLSKRYFEDYFLRLKTRFDT